MMPSSTNHPPSLLPITYKRLNVLSQVSSKRACSEFFFVLSSSVVKNVYTQNHKPHFLATTYVFIGGSQSLHGFTLSPLMMQVALMSLSLVVNTGTVGLPYIQQKADVVLNSCVSPSYCQPHM